MNISWFLYFTMTENWISVGFGQSETLEHVIMDFGKHYRFIEQTTNLLKGDELWAYQFIFNEVAHYLIVEVLDGSPLDALLNILFLRENQKTLEQTRRKNRIQRRTDWNTF